MNREIIFVLAVLFYPLGVDAGEATELNNTDLIGVVSRRSREPLGKPGLVATYRHESGGAIPGSVVRTLTLALGPLEEKNGRQFQWLHLQAAKANGEQFGVWILTDRYPPAIVTAARETVARYILREGNTEPLEFRHQFSGEAVLPSLGAWKHLFPRAPDSASSDGLFAKKICYLGKVYLLESLEAYPAAGGCRNSQTPSGCAHRCSS